MNNLINKMIKTQLREKQLNSDTVEKTTLISSVDDIDNRLKDFDVEEIYESYSWEDIAKILSQIIVKFGGSNFRNNTIFKFDVSTKSISDNENVLIFIQKPMQFSKNRNIIYYGK